MPVQTTIKLRRDTSNNWAAVNPILANGEPGYDVTNNKIKLGDGTTDWSNLSYQVPGNSTTIANGTSTLVTTANGNVTFATATNSNVLTVAANVESLNATGMGNVYDDRVFANAQFMANNDSTLDNMRIEGNLNTIGTVTGSTSLANLTTSNNTILVAANNTITDIFDQGIVANYDPGSGNTITGIFRDSTDFGTWKVFDSLTTYPSTTIDIDSASYANFSAANIAGGLIMTGGDITANISTAIINAGDGSNLTNVPSPNSLVGGTSNVTITPNADVTFNVQNTANIAVVSGTGVTLGNALTVSGETDFGNVANLIIIGGSNNQVVQTDGNGNITWAQISADHIQNGTSNIESTANSLFYVSVGGTPNVVSVGAGEFTTSVDVVIDGNLTSNVVTANLFGGTLDANSNAQPNITSLGTLTELNFNGDPTGNLATNLLPTGNVVFANGTVDLGATANLKITGGTSGQLVQTDGSGGLSLQDNENYPGAPWKINNKYAVGQVVRYMGALYIANGGILANTSFIVGATGATWSPLSQMLRLQQIDLPDYPTDAFIPKASYENASTINIAQTTPAIFLSLDDPMLGNRADGTPKTRILFVNNTGSASLTLNGLYNLSPNYGVIAVWTGTTWQFAAPNPALSNWIFTESQTGLYFTGKSGSIYADDTIITTTANVQVPLNVEGIVAAPLTGSGNLLVFGGGNATMTGNSAYTGTTQIKYATTYTLIDNGLLGTPVANIYTATGGTKTTSGTTVTQKFVGNAVMIIPDTPVPTTFTMEYLVVGGGGGGGSGATYNSGNGFGGTNEDASSIGGAGGGGGDFQYGTFDVNSGSKILVTIGEGGAGGYTRGTDGSNVGVSYNNGQPGGQSTITYIDTSNVTQVITAVGGDGGSGGGDFSKQNLATVPADGSINGAGGNAAYRGGSFLNAAQAGRDGDMADFESPGNFVFYGSGGGGGGASVVGRQTGAIGGSEGRAGRGGNGSVTGSGTAGGAGSDGWGGGGGGGAGLGWGRAGTPGGRGGRGVAYLRYTVNGGGASATGGTVTTSGNTTIHTFTATDVFQIPASATFTQVNYLAVGAGGAGGSSFNGNVIAGYGGGEGGEVVTGSISVAPGQVISVAIGKGGNGQPTISNVAPNIGLVSGTAYDATGKGPVTSIDDIAADSLASILPASGTLKYNIITASGSQTVSVSFKKNGNTISQSLFTLGGNTLAYTSTVNTLLTYAADDHDNLVMDADGRGIIARTNVTTGVTGTNWDKFRGTTEVTLNSAIDTVASYPASAFIGTSNCTYVTFPGTTSAVWINKTTGQYKVNNFTARTMTTAEQVVVGTVYSANVTWTISDGINQFLIGQYNSTAARLFTVNLGDGTMTSTAVTLATAPTDSANQTEEDVFGAQLFTIDGAVSFYSGTTFYYGGSNGFKSDTSPLLTTGRTTFTASSVTATQTGQDVFGSIDANGNVWFADWGHDGGGMFNVADDTQLGTRQTNITTVAAIAGNATPNQVSTAGVINGTSTTLSGVGLTTITAQGGTGATSATGASGRPGANGGNSGTGNGSAGSGGTSSTITGTSVTYGGGGGGGKGALGSSVGAGGSGGGGAGGSTNGAGVDGVTGGGGGGAGTTSGNSTAVYGGKGGDGIVIITYPTPYAAYDATYSNTISAEGTIVHNSYNNQIFNGAISGGGSYTKKKFTSDTFAAAVTLAGNINVEAGTLLIGNGSAGSVANTINLSANTTLQFKRNGTAASPYTHTAPVHGPGNIEFLSTNTVNQSRYDFTSSNIANVTGNITVKANASLLATAPVFGNSNITVESTGAMSVTSGNLTANVFVAGTGWTNGSIAGAISLTGSANVTGNVYLRGDTTIAIANGTSNSTISGNIIGNYSVTYQTPANTVRMILNGNSTYTGSTTITANTAVSVLNTTSIPNVSGVTIGANSSFFPLTSITVGNLNGNGIVFTNTMYDILSVGQNNMDATYTGVVNQGNIAKIGTGTQVFNGNSYGATNGLNGNAWSVTMGNMTIGNADTTSYPSQGNMTVTYPGNLIWNRADITSSGNGVMLLQNLGGNGNITFNGVTGQSYGTGYYHSPIVQSTANYQAVNDYRYPNNTNYTGNIYLQSNSKYSVYDANTRPTKVTVEANSQIYLQAPWVYQFYTSNSSLTLPGNSYTIQGTIVGGGGGGGGGANISSSFRSGHGGSGGGVVTFSETNRAGGTFAIVVGAAGAGGPGVTGGAASGSYGSDGGASSAFGYTAGAGTGGLNNSVGVQTAPAGGGTGGAGRTTDPQNGTLSSVTSSLFNNSVQYSPGGMGGALTGTIPTPLTGASTGSIGIGSIAAIRGTYYGAGGGGGSAANNNAPTAGSAGVGGMVALRYFQNGTPALTTDFILNGNGVSENGTYNGALRSNTAAWTLSGNITVATDARIRADNQPLYLTGNLTGAGNLDLAGNAAINFTSANNTLTGTITIATALYLGNITNTCGYSVSTGALISASANGAPTAYTTTGTLTMALNSRMRVYSDGVNVLSRMDVGSMTVNGAWFIDMLSLTTTSGTYTLIGFTTPAPATVPSLGINGTGKQVVFSYVDGTGLVVTLS